MDNTEDGTLAQVPNELVNSNIQHSNEQSENSSVLTDAHLKSEMHVLMDECVKRANKYPTLNAVLTINRGQGKRLIESFAIASSLASTSYIFCHSYEVKKNGQIRSMSLNQFFSLMASTGYGKTEYIEIQEFIAEKINEEIQSISNAKDDYFSTELPASRQALQRECGLFPVRFYIIDEAQRILLSKSQYTMEALDATRSLFDSYAFCLSATKKKENDNKATGKCLAVMFLSGTTKQMQLGLLSDERSEDGTANRYLIVCPNSYRSDSKKPIDLDDKQMQLLIKTIIESVRKHVHYETVQIGEEFKIQRVIKYIYCDEIENHFDKVESEIAIILDKFERDNLPFDSTTLQITRTGVIKKRIAYMMWLDSDKKNPNQCIEDACFIVDALYKTSNDKQVFESDKLSRADIETRILSLEQKYKKGEKIYLSKITGKKGILDINKHKGILFDIYATLRSLETLDRVTLFDSKKIKSFCFD